MWKETNDSHFKSSSTHSASITWDVALGLGDGLLNYITKSHNKQKGIVSYISKLSMLVYPKFSTNISSAARYSPWGVVGNVVQENGKMTSIWDVEAGSDEADSHAWDWCKNISPLSGWLVDLSPNNRSEKELHPKKKLHNSTTVCQTIPWRYSESNIRNVRKP